MAITFKSVLASGGTSLIIQISTTSESLYGQTITISKNGSTVGTTTFDNTGNAEYTVDEAGTYTVSVTVSGTTYSDTVEVTDTFEASIEAGFNYHTWLTAGDVSDTYSSLAEVLADERAIYQLITKHASVDYLASFTEDDTNVITVLYSDLVAKWVSLTDYAMDKLEEAYEDLLPTIGDYAYIGKVPKMTSATAPSGEVVNSTAYSSNYGYKAFDGDSSTYFSTVLQNRPYYIGYVFTSATIIKKIHVRCINLSYTPTTFKVQGYNGSTWSDITETITNSEIEFDVDLTANNTAYNGYRLYDDAGSGSWEIYDLQMYAHEFQGSKYGYGEWALMPQVPKMTSNAAPYGEAIKDSENSSYYAYKAFDDDTNSYWQSNTSNTAGGQYIGYKFTSPVSVRRYVQTLDEGGVTITVKTQYSDDGSTWNDTESVVTFEPYETKIVNIADNGSHLYWRNIVTSASGGNQRFRTRTLQFYAYQPKGCVPVMTNYTAPYGEVIYSTQYDTTNFKAWQAFDGDENRSSYGWTGGSNDTAPYVGYKSASPIMAKRAKVFVQFRTFTNANSTVITIEGSNDNSTYTSIGSLSVTGIDTTTDVYITYEIPLNSNTFYLYHRIKFNYSMRPANTNYIKLIEAQFYGRQLKVSVPKMSGNTSPYGEAFASSEQGDAYKVFDQSNSSRWVAASQATNNYVGYDFKEPVKVFGVYYSLYKFFDSSHASSTPSRTLTIRGSNDNSTWIDIGTITCSASSSSGVRQTGIVSISNPISYRYYSIFCADTLYVSGYWYIAVEQLNFFGLNYSEKEWDTEHPRHYIYDHGLELESLEQLSTANGWTPAGNFSLATNSKKMPYYLDIAPAATYKEDGFGMDTMIDMTDYSLFRCVHDPSGKEVHALQYYIVNTKSVGSTSLAYLSVQYGHEGSLDISGITQSAYVIVFSENSANRYGRVYEMWLE